VRRQAQEQQRGAGSGSDGVEALTCAEQLDVAGELPDSLLEGEHLVDGNGQHERGPVHPLPRLAVWMLPKAAPRGFVAFQLV
jgi:hypothetical protein